MIVIMATTSITKKQEIVCDIEFSLINFGLSTIDQKSVGAKMVDCQGKRTETEVNPSLKKEMLASKRNLLGLVFFEP